MYETKNVELEMSFMLQIYITNMSSVMAKDGRRIDNGMKDRERRFLDPETEKDRRIRKLGKE